MTWRPFADGNKIGIRGSEGGAIVRDDEHSDCARITLERDRHSAQWTITCGIYGLFVHTRFFSSEVQSSSEYERMCGALSDILGLIPHVDDPEVDDKMAAVNKAIGRFVDLYP